MRSFSMKHALSFALFSAVSAGVCSIPGQAAPIINLMPNLSPTDVQFGPGGPNFTSPSYDAYIANALQGLAADSNQGGSQAVDPAAFNIIGGVVSNSTCNITVRAGDMVATEFNSWRGDLAPTGAFAGENGTHFRPSVHVTDSVAYTLADVVLSGFYDPALGVPPGCCTATLDLIVPPGSERFVGIYWGADGIAGNGDDVIYDTANPLFDPTALLNEILFVGLGDFAVLTIFPGFTNAVVYADWNDFVESFGAAGTTISYSYQLRGTTSTVNVNLVPEPTAFALLGLGFACIGVARRRQ
jgi:PEP-CTERM motif